MDASLTDREADVMRTLQVKGFVGHDEQGRVHRYFPKAQQQAARKSALVAA